MSALITDFMERENVEGANYNVCKWLVLRRALLMTSTKNVE